MPSIYDLIEERNRRSSGARSLVSEDKLIYGSQGIERRWSGVVDDVRQRSLGETSSLKQRSHEKLESSVPSQSYQQTRSDKSNIQGLKEGIMLASAANEKQGNGGHWLGSILKGLTAVEQEARQPLADGRGPAENKKRTNSFDPSGSRGAILGFEPPVDAVTVDPNDDICQSTITTVRGAYLSLMDEYDSPYEKGYCAEDGEELFEEAQRFFEMLEDASAIAPGLLRDAQDRLSNLDEIVGMPEPDFLEAINEAYGAVNMAHVLWDERWVEDSFRGHQMPVELLLLMIQSGAITKAKKYELLHLFTVRKVMNHFKKALSVLDPLREFPKLWACRARSLTTTAMCKQVLYLVRAYLNMKLNGYSSFEAMRKQGLFVDSLDGKCGNVMLKLDASLSTVMASSSASQSSHSEQQQGKSVKSKKSTGSKATGKESRKSTSRNSTKQSAPIEAASRKTREPNGIMIEHHSQNSRATTHSNKEITIDQFQQIVQDDITTGSHSERASLNDYEPLDVHNVKEPELEQMLRACDTLLDDNERTKREVEARDRKLKSLRMQLEAYKEKRLIDKKFLEQVESFVVTKQRSFGHCC